MSWDDWAAGTLVGINAPQDQVNFDTMWAWSNAESGTEVMRWNNPLNTTLPWLSPPSHPMNSVGVQAYLDEASGIAATVRTLLNGYYPVIVDHLRRSVPRQDWGDACFELGTWGTGCGWLAEYYGDAPGVLEADMTPDEHNALIVITQALVGVPAREPLFQYEAAFRQLLQDVADLKVQIGALAPGPAGAEPTTITLKIPGQILEGTLS